MHTVWRCREIHNRCLWVNTLKCGFNIFLYTVHTVWRCHEIHNRCLWVNTLKCGFNIFLYTVHTVWRCCEIHNRCLWVNTLKCGFNIFLYTVHTVWRCREIHTQWVRHQTQHQGTLHPIGDDKNIKSESYQVLPLFRYLDLGLGNILKVKQKCQCSCVLLSSEMWKYSFYITFMWANSKQIPEMGTLWPEQPERGLGAAEHPQRRDVATSMVGLINGHIRANLTQNSKPHRYSWRTQKKKKRSRRTPWMQSRANAHNGVNLKFK